MHFWEIIAIGELTWGALFVFVVIAAMALLLNLTKMKTESVFLLGVVVLFLSGVINEESAFGGFSSESVLITATLFIVVGGLTYTGVINWIVKYMLGKPKTFKKAIARLMFPVAFLSSLIGDTTVVAMFINVVRIWSKKLNLTPSKLLIPLSYAACMGGACTLIGTPTNLLVASFYTESTGETLSIFTPTICGLVCLVVCVLSTIALRNLLPTRKSPMEGIDTDDFTAELTVPSDSLMIGNGLDETGYFDNGDLKVVAIRRFDDEIVTPVEPDEFIMGGDRMIVTGKTDAILNFCRKEHLGNEHIEGILLSEGEIENKGRSTIISSLIIFTMVILSAFSLLPLMHSCILAAVAMIFFKCCTPKQAMKSIEWDVLIIFACSVCIGKALTSTGVTKLLAESLMSLNGNSPYFALFVLCFVATVVTEFLSDTATAAVLTPIALDVATTMHVNPLTFCVAIMIASSANFATPISAHAHMHVFVPGGYKFSDFVKIGIPMNIIILITNVVISCLVFPLV
ncbi:MAG: anion permease [Paludibacteraceae bacterium]|nr:anion permease [Paludibacteraceae bacterium]